MQPQTTATLDIRPIVLEGRYVRLEPLATSHAEGLLAAAGDPEIWRWMPAELTTPERIAAWMADAYTLQQAGSALPFAIVDLADGMPAGVASYLRISPAAGSIEVGHIHYSPRLQKTPAATEAMYLLMERAFELEPGATYDVDAAFDFASADFGDIGLWTIIAGVSEADPETPDDLDFRDETGNGASDDVGHVWGERTYPLGTATAGLEGLLWVALGVWGTFETPRTYFIDDVELTFTRR